MYLRFSSSLIAAVAVARAPNGGEPGSGRSARRARKENEMVGILAVDASPLKADRDPRALQAATAPTCMVDGEETPFVDCTVEGADCKQNCLDACIDKDDCSCCVGGLAPWGAFYEACGGFQGKVCPDGSCSGASACGVAAIDYVADGCHGRFACYNAGGSDRGENGYVGSVVSSCKGEQACAIAARGGSIKGISLSCNADFACKEAAAFGGAIQEISLSCNNVTACQNAARSGTIPNNMERCCNSLSACEGLARDGEQDPDQCDAPPSSSPTKAPSSAPTKTPSSAPTKTPSSAPTKTPSSAPTKAPSSAGPETTGEHAWDAAPEGIDSDFSSPGGAAVNSTFTVGKGGAEVVIEAALFQEDCETEAAGGVLELLEPNPQQRRPKNQTHDTVIVQVGINKTGLGGSPFWDPVASVISYCEKLRLKTNSSLLTTQLVVTELVKLVSVFVDGNATFSLGANLTGLAADFVNRTIDLAGSLKAFRCRGASFLPSAGSLSPNELLNICLQPSTDGVEVASVDRVTLDQDDAGLDIVAGGNIALPSITSREYVPAERGWLVSSRVPANVITFAAGRTLEVSGSVRMGLVGGAADARRLQQVPAAGSGDREEEAFFDVEVDLVGEEAVDGVAAFSPAASWKSKGGATAAAALSGAFALVFFMG